MNVDVDVDARKSHIICYVLSLNSSSSVSLSTEPTCTRKKAHNPLGVSEKLCAFQGNAWGGGR